MQAVQPNPASLRFLETLTENVSDLPTYCSRIQWLSNRNRLWTITSLALGIIAACVYQYVHPYAALGCGALSVLALVQHRSKKLIEQDYTALLSLLRNQRLLIDAARELRKAWFYQSQELCAAESPDKRYTAVLNVPPDERLEPLPSVIPAEWAKAIPTIELVINSFAQLQISKMIQNPHLDRDIAHNLLLIYSEAVRLRAGDFCEDPPRRYINRSQTEAQPWPAPDLDVLIQQMAGDWITTGDLLKDFHQLCKNILCLKK